MAQNTTNLEPGQRFGYLRGSLRMGATLLKTKRPKPGGQSQSTYIIELDETKERIEVSQDAVHASPWTLLPGVTLAPDRLEKLLLALHTDWLAQKTAEVIANRDSRKSDEPEKTPIVAFYHPSEAQYGERNAHKEVPHYEKAKMQDAVKRLKKELESQYEGIPFELTHRKDKVTASWIDGPVFLSPGITGRFLHTPLNDSPITSISPHREISDCLIQSAISFIQCVLRIDPDKPESKNLVDASLYRNGVLRSIFIPGSTYDMSYQDLTRVVLLRWDDHAQRFLGEGRTRHMLAENATIFSPFQGDMTTANSIMHEIRRLAIKQALKDRESLVEFEFTQDRYM